MHNLCVRTELLDITGHPVIETRANGNQHITVMHGHIGFIGTVHAQHADILPVSGRIASQTHQGVGDREVQQPGHFGQ